MAGEKFLKPFSRRAAKPRRTAAYLVDADNPTGYAQVLKEWDATPGGTDRIDYVLGLDVIGQKRAAQNPEYFLYDGHGSVRQVADNAEAMMALGSLYYSNLWKDYWTRQRAA